MAKKRTKVKNVKKVEIIENKPLVKSPKQKKSKIEQALVDNFVSMQKVLANLAVKFDSLAEQISKLLQLFEISAKSFIEKQKNIDSEDRQFIEKLNTLLEQNKTIARGLTLLEQKMREKYGSAGPQTTYSPFQPASMPNQPSLGPSTRAFSSSETEDEENKIKPKPLPRI